MSTDAGVKPFGGDGEVEAVMRGFESCALAPPDFGHREHVAVALCCLWRDDLEAALARVRAGLHNFIRHHGVDPKLYHETVTLFWLRRVRSLMQAAGGARTLAETANGVLKSCADSKVIYQYYSRELLATDEARASWVEPDLRPLDF